MISNDHLSCTFYLLGLRIKFRILSAIFVGILVRMIGSLKASAYTGEYNAGKYEHISMTQAGFEPTFLVLEQSKPYTS
jgi:hypothetical protein